MDKIPGDRLWESLLMNNLYLFLICQALYRFGFLDPWLIDKVELTIVEKIYQ